MISQSNNNNNIYNSNRNRNNGSSNNNNNNDDDSEEGDDEPIIKGSIYRTTTVDVNGKDTSDIYTAENDDYLDNNSSAIIYPIININTSYNSNIILTPNTPYAILKLEVIENLIFGECVSYYKNI